MSSFRRGARTSTYVVTHQRLVEHCIVYNRWSVGPARWHVPLSPRRKRMASTLPLSTTHRATRFLAGKPTYTHPATDECGHDDFSAVRRPAEGGGGKHAYEVGDLEPIIANANNPCLARIFIRSSLTERVAINTSGIRRLFPRSCLC